MGTLEILTGLKAEAEAEVSKFDGAISQLAIDIKAAEDKGYQQALDDQQVPADQKVYTEADLQAELASLAAVKDAAILDLQNQVNSIPTQISTAIETLKAQLKQAYQDQQVVETTSETGFAALLS